MTSTFARCLVPALLTLAGASAQAAFDLAVLSAQADTSLTEHGGLGGGDANLGHDTALYTIAPAGFRSLSLVRFDLSAFAGQTVLGGAQLDMSFLGMPYSSSTQISIAPVLTSWGEYSVTWNNFGGASNFAGQTGAAVGGDSVIGAANSLGSQISFVLPTALVQGWIDHPGSNHGLMLSAVGAADRDLYFASREFTPSGGSTGDWAPALSFSAAAAVPEPEGWVLMAAGLGALGLLARRRRAAD